MTSTNPLFRELSEAEIAEFRQWARNNYKVGEPISGLWHPIIQQECVAMNVNPPVEQSAT
jgi:hypothetical protein